MPARNAALMVQRSNRRRFWWGKFGALPFRQAVERLPTIFKVESGNRLRPIFARMSRSNIHMLHGKQGRLDFICQTISLRNLCLIGRS